MNLHPGVASVLRRLDMDELGVARAMVAGELASPQRYKNLSLYAMRVTGTGTSYRPPPLDEWVFRRPENYLTEDFLARCAGLPVIMKHPNKNLMDSVEFVDRVVGTVMLPYIKEDEVWCIARVYVDEAVELLNSEVMSTSPSVVLAASSKFGMPDGSKLLVEGKPTLLDHLAIVPNGVWDKGGDPSGIEADIRGDSAMAEKTKEEMEKERDDAARKDASDKLDQLLKGVSDAATKMDSCMQRMDAFEAKEKERDDAARKDAAEKEKDEKEKADKAKKDAEDPEAMRLAADKAKKDAAEKEEKEKADKAKKDADEKEKAEKEKADSTRADSVAGLSKRLEESEKTIAALLGRVPKDLTDAELATMTGIQSRADEVFVQFGKRAPRAQLGETAIAYRRRLAEHLRPFSDKWKSIELSAVRDDAFEGQVENQIYADAALRAMQPNDLDPGSIREIKRTTPSGHIETSFVGNNYHFVKRFSRPPQRGRVLDPRAQKH